MKKTVVRASSLLLSLALVACQSSLSGYEHTGAADGGGSDIGLSTDASYDGGATDSATDLGSPLPDLGLNDAGDVDATAIDMSTPPIDAGDVDAGEADAGMDAFIPPMDAGELDAGMDAGVMDAGPSDAGPPTWPVIDGGPSSTRHVKRPLGTTLAAAGYWEYLPPAYGEDDYNFPLLVFYHGVGENGDGSNAALDLVPANGPPMLINNNEWPLSRPFVVLSPQHAGGGCPSASEIHSFIAYAASTYDVDVHRIYLTGLSCGAIGAWSYLGSYADERQIAAMVPIAGDGNGAWSAQGCDLGKVAIWAFHGDADTTVLPTGTTGPMDHLIGECPSPPREDALMTIYPGVGHSSWWQTYNLSAGHDIYAWMLTHTND